MSKVRKPAVAGLFYPSEPAELREAIKVYLKMAKGLGPVPKAVIVPHAGYIYSGPIAANAYALVGKGKDFINRVVLLGTAHRVEFTGLATTGVDEFLTPLGSVPVDQKTIGMVSNFSRVHCIDQAHDQEHSLEVQLPFLQIVLNDFQIIPFVVGDCSPDEVADVLDHLWGKKETLIVVSSDLSHYLDDESAKRIDTETSKAIEHLHFEGIETSQACGAYPMKGLLAASKRHRMKAKALDVRNSGDTAGPHDRVVGYGAYAFWEV